MGYELATLNFPDSLDPDTLDFAADDCPVYRRVNGKAMTALLRAMESCGMAYKSEPAGPRPSEDFDAPDTILWLSSVEHPMQGIPEHKLSSNEGWVVTGEECASALGRWAAWNASATGSAVPASVRRFPQQWKNWLSWLSSAANSGGFQIC